jgi:hypothetical protein
MPHRGAIRNGNGAWSVLYSAPPNHHSVPGGANLKRRGNHGKQRLSVRGMPDHHFGDGPGGMHIPCHSYDLEDAMETTIDFRGSSIRYVVLAGDAPRENHEDATIRLMIERERRRGKPEPEQRLIVLAHEVETTAGV